MWLFKIRVIYKCLLPLLVRWENSFSSPICLKFLVSFGYTVLTIRLFTSFIMYLKRTVSRKLFYSAKEPPIFTNSPTFIPTKWPTFKDQLQYMVKFPRYTLRRMKYFTHGTCATLTGKNITFVDGSFIIEKFQYRYILGVNDEGKRKR